MNTESTTHAQQADSWLALVIGNSRLHWAHFIGTRLQTTWNTPHFSSETIEDLISHQFDFSIVPQSSLWGPETRLPSATVKLSINDVLPSLNLEQPEVWIASVVPQQSHLWQAYPAARFVALEDIPLNGMYPTLGIDRALAVWGAIVRFGSPMLVIDAGTALTFTGAGGDHHLIGGAILPGFSLQFQALDQRTAALPFVQMSNAETLPPHWAVNTEDAIASGVIHTLLAGVQEFIHAWWQQFPGSSVVITGGDGDRLYHYLKQRAANLTSRMAVEPSLVFLGMQAVQGTGDRL